MAYNEKLAERVREQIKTAGHKAEEKAMFGGLCFLVKGKMCLGVETERLMVRFNPAEADLVKQKEGFRPMDFTGRVMKGYAFVGLEYINTAKKLAYWVNLALAYNPVAKASPKKKG